MADIEHRELRSALEYAVLIAAEGQKRRPPLPFPKNLKPFLNTSRLPASALGRVRRAVETSPDFRQAIASGAVPELVDEIGTLWLHGREGWEDQAASMIAERDDEAASNDLRKQLKRSDKRRLAAEQVAARTRAELLVRDQTVAEQAAEIDTLRAELMKADDEIAEVRAELLDTRNEIRHARDRERAAVARLDAAARERHASGGGRVETPVPAPQAVGVEPVASELRSVRDELDRERRRTTEIAAASAEFVARIDELTGDTRRSDIEAAPAVPSAGPSGLQRTPVALPGGVISTSAEAAEHLVRSDAAVLVDGYNVAKLAWSDRRLDQQREALIDRCENLARRRGTDLTIVFDGASVAGAHASSRRHVRVVYSPDGISADDVIRAEVDRLPVERGVVVVTNDREIVDDVRRQGANVIPSNAFIAVF